MQQAVECAGHVTRSLVCCHQAPRCAHSVCTFSVHLEILAAKKEQVGDVRAPVAVLGALEAALQQRLHSRLHKSRVTLQRLRQ